MNNEKAKQKIKNLVEKYQRVAEAGQINSYNEEMTKKDFILPLFRALGWNIEDSQEVSAEVHTLSSGRVDYAFIINDSLKFYLEAKALKEDLSREDFAKQAIRYAWNKGITWAVLTDFESIKIFNAQAASKYLGDKLFREIKWNEYLERFDELYLLSKESLEQGLLDNEAEKIGKKLQKITVSEQLYKDLNDCREELAKELKQWNPKLSDDDLDEGVQKILDRLVFIRVAEDRGLEPERSLLAMVHEYQSNKKMGKVPLFKTMIKRFRELDNIYDSSLFAPHACENWEEFSGITEKIIQRLYGKTGCYDYDFKEIPADVLGAVYENYLGYIAKKPIKAVIDDKSGKLFEVEGNKEVKIKSRQKRKEQGIYYTPSFIVDYIVQNTVGRILEGKTVEEVKNLKILDPACGSGSFLNKAYQTLIDFREKNEEKINTKTKLGKIAKIIQEKGINKELSTPERLQILHENIFGVDLDKQAVEIARLNLLLNAVTKRTKLPNLVNNIKWGNSLISGTDAELKKYFGENWREKRPFNWDEEFSFCHSRESGNLEGGFDVIIGNPPYVRNRELQEEDKEYFDKSYFSAQGQYDIYQLFFEKAINLLKENGLLGFITSNKYAIADYGKKLREFILENCKIVSIVDVSDFQVFKDASTYPYIIILQKTKNNFNNQIKGLKIKDEFSFDADVVNISQDEIKDTATKNFTIKKSIDFLKHVEKLSEKLGEIATIKETIHTGNVRSKLIVDNKIDDSCKKLLAGRDCHRYWFKWSKKYIRYDKNLIDKNKGEYGNLCDGEYFENPKILLRDISRYPEAVFDDEKFYSVNTLYSIQFKNHSRNLFFLLAMLNSTLIRFYFLQKFEDAHVAGGFLRFKKIYTSQIPIYKINFFDKKEKSKHDELVKLADMMIDLNKQLLSLAEHSDKWQAIKSEIEKTDHLIDQKVYELYRLSDDEVKIIEGEKQKE